MRLSSNRILKKFARKSLFSATESVLEPMETRVLFAATVIDGWNFNQYANNTAIIIPAASTASTTSSATSMGMQHSGGTYTLGQANTTGNAEASAIANATGSSDSGSNATWKLKGSNGWNSSTPYASQGAQFLASTANYTGVSAKFDWLPSAQGEQKLVVEYTTNGSTWIDAISATNTTLLSGVTLQNNSGGVSANTIPGYYLQYTTNGSVWADGITVDLSSITAANNDASFGIRIVGASQGADCTAVAGTALNNTSGNWSFDEVQVLGTSAVPTVTTQPVNVSNAVLGTPVTFTAAVSALVTETPNWQQVLSGATTNLSNGSAYTITTTAVGSTTTSTLTFYPTTSQSGATYDCSFTSTQQTATTNSALLTVLGAPITTWQYNSTETGQYGTNFPPVVGSGTLTGLGMVNNYYLGFQSIDDSDVLLQAGTSDPGYVTYQYRVRGGSSSTPGTPEGWSNFAPNGTQGIQWNVSTAGYTAVNSHFDWYGSQSGPALGQLQYSTGSAVWSNYNGGGAAAYNFNSTTGVVQAGADDYFGTTSTSVAGVVLNTAYIPGADNNPNFAVRLVSVYDNRLPQLFDNNALVTDSSNNPIAHGQYSQANASTPALSQQEIVIGGQGLSGQFTLTVNNSAGVQTTAPISYSNQYNNLTGVSVLATNIQNALNALNGSNNSVKVYSDDGSAINFIIGFTAAQNAPVIASTSGGAITSPLTGSNFTSGNIASYSVKDINSGTTVNAAANVGVTTIYAGNIQPYSLAGSGNWRFANIQFYGTPAAGVPAITNEPANSIATVGGSITSSSQTFTSTAYSSAAITASWQETLNGTPTTLSDTGGTTQPLSNGDSYSVQTVQVGTNSYVSTLIFTTTTTSDSGAQFVASFTSAGNTTASTPATLTVVSPVAPTLVAGGNPTSQTVILGQAVNLTATVVGNPLADGFTTTNWQVSSDSMTWSNVNTSAGSGFVQTQTYSTVTTGTNAGLTKEITLLSFVPSVTGTLYYRVFLSNAAGSLDTSSATLSVLTPEAAILQWNFSSTVAAPDNTPAPTLNITSGSLSTTAGIASISDDVLSSPSVADLAYNLFTWRVRGTGPGGTDTNGWSNSANQYTQGMEIDVNTMGYQDLYTTLQWYSTNQGIRDLQVQYNLNTGNSGGWTNYGSTLIANPNDFYGAVSGAAPSGIFVNLSSITGANNNATFGIRLVAAYDSTGNLGAEYASASLNNGQTVQYNGTSGNWRFGNISVNANVFHPAWYNPGTSTFTWNSTTQVLNVTSGTGEIVADPQGTNTPTILVSGAGTSVLVDSTAHLGTLNISGGATVSMNTSASATLVIAVGSNTFAIDSSSKLDLKQDFLDIQAANASAGAIQLGTVAGMITLPVGSVGITSSTASADSSYLHALGVIENNGMYGLNGSIGSTFGGVQPGTFDTLVRYTYVADTNLDGKVDGSDYSRIDSSYLADQINPTAVAGWGNGDLNGDGTVNGSDYTLMDNAFNRQGAYLSPASQIYRPLSSPSAIITGQVTNQSDEQRKAKSSLLGAGQDVLDALCA